MCLATVRMFNKLLHSMMVYTRSLPHVGLHKRLLAWEKKKSVSTPTPTPVSFTRSQQTVMIIRMVLCLHPSAKKSLNAKTQTQSQKERLMSHPFYHLFILIKHSSDWTLCWGPNSTSSDLYRKPPWILVFSTISEVDFQLFSSLPTRSFQNGLLCQVRISWCMYIYI